MSTVYTATLRPFTHRGIFYLETYRTSLFVNDISILHILKIARQSSYGHYMQTSTSMILMPRTS